MLTTPIATGNNFVAEEDIVQTLEDGRVILLAAKGAAVPMPLAEKMGLPALQKQGITQVGPDMTADSGPGGFTLGLTPDQIKASDQDGSTAPDGGSPPPPEGGSTTDTSGSGSGSSTSTTPGTAGSGSGAGDGSAPAPSGGVPSSSAPSGFVVQGAVQPGSEATQVQMIDLHESVAGSEVASSSPGQASSQASAPLAGAQPKQPAKSQAQGAKPKAASGSGK